MVMIVVIIATIIVVIVIIVVFHWTWLWDGHWLVAALLFDVIGGTLGCVRATVPNAARLVCEDTVVEDRGGGVLRAEVQVLEGGVVRCGQTASALAVALHVAVDTGEPEVVGLIRLVSFLGLCLEDDQPLATCHGGSGGARHAWWWVVAAVRLNLCPIQGCRGGGDGGLGGGSIHHVDPDGHQKDGREAGANGHFGAGAEHAFAQGKAVLGRVHRAE